MGQTHHNMILADSRLDSGFRRRLRQRYLAQFLEKAAAAARLRGDISALLTTDAEIRRLNREFRHKDKATDVLSFPAPEPVRGQPRLSGDLAISVETAARQAQDAGHSLFTELQVLLLHGVLHLAGYDHETDTGEMARKEAALRKKLGLQAGLIERAARPIQRRPGKPGATRS